MAQAKPLFTGVLAGAYKPTSGKYECIGRVTSLIDDPMIGMDVKI